MSFRLDKAAIEAAVARGLAGMFGRADANETLAFSRQLEQIIAGSYDIEYPDLKARTLIPVNNSVSTGAQTWTWRQFDRVGEARLMSTYGAKDLPTVEAFGKEQSNRIVSLGASYVYSLQELRSAAFGGIPLEARKAEAVRTAMEEKLESLAMLGDSTVGFTGLANDANLTAVTKGTQASGTTWATATIAEILADLNKMQNQIFTATQGVHTGNALLVPTATYGRLATTARSPTFTDDSMLQYILKQSPWLKSIEFSPRMNTAGASSVGRVMLYEKNPRVLEMIVPQEFEQFAPQQDGLMFRVPCHMRFGGVTIKYPKALCYMDGCE